MALDVLQTDTDIHWQSLVHLDSGQQNCFSTNLALRFESHHEDFCICSIRL